MHVCSPAGVPRCDEAIPRLGPVRQHRPVVGPRVVEVHNVDRPAPLSISSVVRDPAAEGCKAGASVRAVRKGVLVDGQHLVWNAKLDPSAIGRQFFVDRRPPLDSDRSGSDDQLGGRLSSDRAPGERSKPGELEASFCAFRSEGRASDVE